MVPCYCAGNTTAASGQKDEKMPVKFRKHPMSPAEHRKPRSLRNKRRLLRRRIRMSNEDAAVLLCVPSTKNVSPRAIGKAPQRGVGSARRRWRTEGAYKEPTKGAKGAWHRAQERRHAAKAAKAQAKALKAGGAS